MPSTSQLPASSMNYENSFRHDWTMHEVSLINDLMRRIEAIARAQNAERIACVSVWIGALSHMSADHFAEHFTRAAAGGLAEGAELNLTLSDDLTHADAQNLVLESVEIEAEPQ